MSKPVIDNPVKIESISDTIDLLAAVTTLFDKYKSKHKREEFIQAFSKGAGLYVEQVYKVEYERACRICVVNLAPLYDDLRSEAKKNGGFRATVHFFRHLDTVFADKDMVKMLNRMVDEIEKQIEEDENER